ncbi:MAG: hypothetical protein M1820_007472 [Bogoriella megaspora]|nr:MAG: hypothetical protein M1820_007472 [Bogoriella megaspora]
MSDLRKQGQLAHNATSEDFAFLDLFDLAESDFEERCRWCSLIHRSMIELGAQLPEVGRPGYARVSFQEGRPIYVEWTGKSRITAEIYQIEGMSAQPGHSDAIPGLGYASDICPSLSSAETFDRIKSWVSQCEKTHFECKRLFPAAPRRLLDIEDPYCIRLVANRAEPVDYIALSHRWGKIQPCKTTQASLTERMTLILWEQLPKTYQDAIIVAQRLGISYIWIDSLCIVQDDLVEWVTESVKMSAIFEDSYLTIAATSALDDDHGFLESSAVRANYFSRSVDLSDYGVEGDPVRVRTIHDFRTEDGTNYLAKRAWALQESLFPHRLLTIGATVRLECRRGTFCECGSGLSPDPFCGPAAIFRKVDRTGFFKNVASDQQTIDRYDFWYHNIVVEYTDRKLTFHKDRLPAIAALARRYALLTNDVYLAGLWKTDLTFGMCWATERGATHIPERAPSWSWASLEGLVRWPSALRGITKPSMEVLSTQLDTKIEYGSMLVRARARAAWLQISWSEDNQHRKFDWQLKSDRRDAPILSSEGGLGYAQFDCPLFEQYPLSFLQYKRPNLRRSASHEYQVNRVFKGNVLCILLREPNGLDRNQGYIFLILGAKVRNNSTQRSGLRWDPDMQETRDPPSERYERLGTLRIDIRHYYPVASRELFDTWLNSMTTEHIILE